MTSSDPGAQPDTVPPVRSEPETDEGTAEARVAAASRDLDSLGTRPLTEHAPVYEALHDQLQSVLADIDGA